MACAHLLKVKMLRTQEVPKLEPIIVVEIIRMVLEDKPCPDSPGLVRKL